MKFVLATWGSRGDIEPSLAGPARPQDRVRLSDMKPSFEKALDAMLAQRGKKIDVVLELKVNDKVLFLVEAKQAGLFEIRNVPQDQMQPIIAIACPQIVYPYLRATVADVLNRTGFPPVHLTEVNFQAMYESQLQQAAANGQAPQA